MMYVMSEVLLPLVLLSLVAAIIGWGLRDNWEFWLMADDEPGTDLERKLQEQLELTMRLRDDLDTTRTRLRDLDGQIAAREPERQALEGELDRRKTAIRALEKGIETGRHQLSSKLDALERARSELKASRMELDDARVYIALLEEQARQLKVAGRPAFTRGAATVRIDVASQEVLELAADPDDEALAEAEWSEPSEGSPHETQITAVPMEIDDARFDEVAPPPDRDLRDERPQLPPQLTESPRQLSVGEAKERVSAFAKALATAGERDDLQQIKGIGPKTAQGLDQLGITSYRQLGLLPDEEVDVIAKAVKASPSRIRRDGWLAQARRLHQLKTGEQLV